MVVLLYAHVAKAAVFGASGLIELACATLCFGSKYSLVKPKLFEGSFVGRLGNVTWLNSARLVIRVVAQHHKHSSRLLVNRSHIRSR